ncbi:prolyl aminopeptidase [Solihabitans fulvus]|uniref:Proline iminopeptidase n=1 Tax=Solihabitans fulvus TaxID=1892852 RepID=A0A5B2X465_9PSEU|nr:prolyl aminopeptidase [Solihabitans fulvus]KAA2258098.1 prolyl aminopeptidase [Solihabitans fulvus]
MGAPTQPIEPYDQGMLDVGDGNHVYWETIGNPDGKPALYVHGGPGSGCSPRARNRFDQELFRGVLFDQRGCGRSTPHAADPATDMSHNTTEHLIADMERLREHLGIDRWLLFGGSWGCTLALAYAERFPDRVTEIILVSVMTSRQTEIDWLYRGAGRIFPEQWARFRDGVPEADRDGDLLAAYARLMAHPDQQVRERAALDWMAWEDAVLSLEPNAMFSLEAASPSDSMLAFVRICAHYFGNGGWLADGAIMRDIDRLADIPAVLVHGRHDLSCPLETVWNLAKAWPSAELAVIEDSGHKGSEAMRERLAAAFTAFAPQIVR